MPICAECIAFGKHKGHYYVLLQQAQEDLLQNSSFALKGNEVDLRSIEQIQKSIIGKRGELLKEIAGWKEKTTYSFLKVQNAASRAEKEWQEALQTEQRRVQSEIDKIFLMLKSVVTKTRITKDDLTLLGQLVTQQYSFMNQSVHPEFVTEDIKEIWRRISLISSVTNSGCTL